MVKVENLCLEIKKDMILKEINIEFEKGKIHGLVGRNGSGKTMLMKCICGFVRPTKGVVTVQNSVIGKDRDFPESLGLIIETPGFIPYYSGYRNLRILAEPNGTVGKKDILAVLERVGLAQAVHRRVGKYSLGMRQRLGIAQAIMENPKLLVLDEPFNGLDKEGVEDMRKILLELKEQGTTIIMASHNGEDIRLLCDTVQEMEKGGLVGDSEENK
ncbi:MAG: ATP-binding cassette domain-containing protein [Lachnospiraceae bacterium]|nr:ATP-binding cassette domain-containing protein [Lachnospiraceae bacterium]